MKSLLKAAFCRTPYRIIRARDANRFQAIEETLQSLKRRGFAPKVIIDGGANVGAFARLANRIFGVSAEVLMFEPQPACLPFLEALSKEPGFTLHATAIGSKSDQSLELAIDPAAVTTGAHVARTEASSGFTVSVPVITLDNVFENTLGSEDRAVLKLDLQGWELEALLGAHAILPRVEVVLIEVSFFTQDYEPPIATLVRFFDEADFDLHDIASLGARCRDNRAHQADFLFVNRRSPLAADKAWG